MSDSPSPLQESTSQHNNIPHCAAQTIEVKVIESKDDDSKEAEEQHFRGNENEFTEIIATPRTMEPSTPNSDAPSEFLKHYARPSQSPNASPDFGSPDRNSSSYGGYSPLSFDEITQMMGADTFESEFADNLFREEQGRAPQWFSAHNRMPSGRREMIDWIRTTAFKHQFTDATHFRALFFLDKLCSIKRVVSKHLRVAAAVCLYIAAKYNEVDANVPRLGRFCGRHLDVDAMIKAEVSILDAFGFQLKTVLPIDFVLHWIDHQRVVFVDDLIGGVRASTHSHRQYAKSLERFSVFFLNMAASDHSFWACPASVMAASVLCAARRVLGIAPYWNRKLANVVRHSPRGFAECFSALWKEYARRFPSKCNAYTATQPLLMTEFI